MAEQVLIKLPVANNCPRCGMVQMTIYTYELYVSWRARNIEGGKQPVGIWKEGHSCGQYSNIAQIIERGA